MGLNAVSLVVFQDLTDDEEFRNHYGILFDDGFILCLCCGSWIEPEDYTILINFHGFNLDEFLKHNLNKKGE